MEQKMKEKEAAKVNNIFLIHILYVCLCVFYSVKLGCFAYFYLFSVCQTSLIAV